MSVQDNIFEKRHRVLQATRSKIFSNGPKKGCTVWLTGLSGAGKTTISFHLEEFLVSHGIATYSLDGDNVRKGLNKNLAFSESDREENVRRVAEVGRLFADAGFICLCSLVSPYAKDRKMARDIHEAKNIPFFEIFVNTPLEVCEKRDIKGLYEKARKGIIKQFTGIDQPYESPIKPDLIVETVQCSIESAIQQVTKLLLENNIIELKLQNGCDIFSEHVIVKELFVNSVRKDAILKHLQHFSKIELSRVDMEWVQVLSEGWASPLNGFMNEKQYLQVLHFNSLIMDDGMAYSQSVPIVLAIDDQKKNEIEQSSQNAVSLWFRGRCYALLNSYEIYEHRKEERCCRQFGTSNQKHPYVKMIYESGNWLIGGKLEVLERIVWNDDLDQFRLTPNELRQKFKDLKTDAVYAFQLRNPIHNGHALLMSDTKKKLLSEGYQRPILLLHPLGGWTKDDDVPLRVRIKQHQAILESNVIDRESTVLAIFPSPMMYAGPTEVQWHAKARMNAGVNFYIVGRDPAGIPHPDRSTLDGNLYEASHGSKVLNMAPNLNNLHIIPFKVASYDKKISKMTYFDPSRPEDFLFISGTKMREFARSNIEPPVGFMDSKAWDVLVDYYRSL